MLTDNSILSFLGLLLLTSFSTASDLSIIEDKDLYPFLPQRELVENVEDKIFRTTDGKTLFFGPTKEKDFYIIHPDSSFKHIKAPSVGKAYYANNAFVLWYDELKDGIHFNNGQTLFLKDPLRDRFGVSYNAFHFYVYHNHVSKIFSVDSFEKALFEIEGFFIYKLITIGDVFWVFGFEYLGHEYTRSHKLIKYEKFNQSYLAIKKRKFLIL